MPDSQLTELAEEIRRLQDRYNTATKSRGYAQGVVVSVDLDAKTCEALMQGDETAETLTLTAQHGFLPRVGDSVLVSLNGADPFVLAPRTMVEGDMQSQSYVEGVSGWMIDAAGNAEFNDIAVRGFVNGIRVNQPPLALFESNGTDYPFTVADDTWTTLTGFELVRSNTQGPHGTNAYTITLSSARVAPGRVGLWEVNVHLGWDLNANGTYRRLQLINDDLTEAYDLDITGPDSGLVMHNVVYPVEVVDASHHYAVRVRHDAGGDLDVVSARMFWKYISD